MVEVRLDKLRWRKERYPDKRCAMHLSALGCMASETIVTFLLLFS